MKTHRNAAFTLIELLIVMGIIAILASIVLAAAGAVQAKSRRSRAQTEIAAMTAALENYKADNGDYPINSSAGSLALITSLMPTNGSKVYFEFKPKFTNATGWVDPYGLNYQYSYTNSSTNNGTNNYDLWSYGATTTNSITNKWIKNW
jgi:general secretion pathway protein G